MGLRMIKQVDRESIGRTHLGWNSILSGTSITLGFGIFFILFGNAIGLNIFNTVNPVVHGGLKFWSWLYSAVTIIASYGLGAMISTRSMDVRESAGGALHGLVSWGLSTTLATLFGVFASDTAASILKGTGPNEGNWFALVAIGFGFFASMAGGMIGKASAGAGGETIEETEEKKAGAA